MGGTESSSAGRNLNQIETLWPVLMRAHGGISGDAGAAQLTILQRYRPAVYRYLRACLGCPDAADEVWQDFSLRFVRGDFRNANPEKGRFRDLLKTAIYHMIIDHHKRKKRSMANLSPDAPEVPDDAPETPSLSDQKFLEAWRNELLNRCWEALAEEERRTGRLLHTVLRCRAANQEMRSHEMAAVLAKQLSRAITADWVRKWVAIARNKFAAQMLREVAGSLKVPDVDAVEQELIDLELHPFCKEALERWREGGSIEG
ncbi:MAG: RNA polymerase sigma factor [Gemmataceae bacterium]